MPVSIRLTWAGVDVQKEGVSNNFDKFVWEPALVKINAIQAASEAASSVLSVCFTLLTLKLKKTWIFRS